MTKASRYIPYLSTFKLYICNYNNNEKESQKKQIFLVYVYIYMYHQSISFFL